MMHSTQFDSPSLASKYSFAYTNALKEERLRLDIDKACAQLDGLVTYVGTPEGNAHARAMQSLQKFLGRPETTWQLVRAKHVQHLATMAFAEAVAL